MAIQPVLMLGNELLRRRCAEVDFRSDDVAACLRDLQDTLRHLQELHGIGCAMAAPQIGVLKRIVYMERLGGEDEPIVMINPRITARSPENFPVWDFCYSADVAFLGQTERHRHIAVDYFDEKQNRHAAEFSGDLAVLFQHEIDHLEGILFTDRIVDNRIIMRPEWEKLQ